MNGGSGFPTRPAGTGITGHIAFDNRRIWGICLSFSRKDT